MKTCFVISDMEKSELYSTDLTKLPECIIKSLDNVFNIKTNTQNLADILNQLGIGIEMQPEFPYYNYSWKKQSTDATLQKFFKEIELRVHLPALARPLILDPTNFLERRMITRISEDIYRGMTIAKNLNATSILIHPGQLYEKNNPIGLNEKLEILDFQLPRYWERWEERKQFPKNINTNIEQIIKEGKPSERILLENLEYPRYPCSLEEMLKLKIYNGIVLDIPHLLHSIFLVFERFGIGTKSANVDATREVLGNGNIKGLIDSFTLADDKGKKDFTKITHEYIGDATKLLEDGYYHVAECDFHEHITHGKILKVVSEPHYHHFNHQMFLDSIKRGKIPKRDIVIESFPATLDEKLHMCKMYLDYLI